MTIQPIAEHSIMDSTKLKEFMRCPRRFFYKYVLGWQLDDSNESLHLVFGKAWHSAMEYLSNCLKDHGKYLPEDVEVAFNDHFLPAYRQSFIEGQDFENAPKNPDNAHVALKEYTKRYERDGDLYMPIYSEIVGTVPIGPNRNLTFKIDGIVQEKQTGRYIVKERKTASKLDATWMQQWTLSVQVGTYLHAMHCLIGADKQGGAIIDGAIFRKMGNEFVRVPVEKTEDQLDAWLMMVNRYMDQHDAEWELLQESEPDDKTMVAFPMNTESCYEFGRICPYFDFCVSWSNPLQHITDGQAPDGFVVRHWNPQAEWQNAKVVNIGETQ